MKAQNYLILKITNPMSWKLLLDYILCGVMGFGLRYIQDRKKIPKPDFWFQLASSTALTAIAYFSYGFYKIQITPLEIWIIVASWLSAFIVTTGDYITKNSLMIYFRKAAEEFLALTKKKED